MFKSSIRRIVSLFLAFSMVLGCANFCYAQKSNDINLEEVFANPDIHLDMSINSDVTETYDVTGNYNATVYGTPSVVDGPDGDNTALGFIYNYQHVRIENPAELDFSKNFAVSVTFYQRRMESSDKMLVIKRNRNADLRDFQLFIDSSNQISFVVRNSDGTWTTAVGRQPAANKWHTAVAMVKNNVMYLYLDGELQSTVQITKVRQPSTTSPISIGADTLENSHTAASYISDVKIVADKAVKNYVAPKVEADIHYTMDSENIGYDVTENGYNAAIKGSLTAAEGVNGDTTALQFNYSSGLVLNSPSDISFNGDYSIEVTFKQTEINGMDQLIVSKRNRAIDLREFQLYLTSADNQLKFIIRDSNDSWVHCAGPVINTGEWHTVIATVKDNVMQLYLDSQLVAVSVITNSRMPSTSAPVGIGADPNSGITEGLVGVISDVKISDSAAKESTVKFEKTTTAAVSELKEGEVIFSDRDYVWREVIPDFFKGMKFNKGAITGGTYTTKEGGIIYALTPNKNVSGSASLEDQLKSYGFMRVNGIDFQAFGWGADNFVHVYAKQVVAEEQFTIGKWAVIVAQDLSITSTDYVENWANNTGELLYNGIRLPETWPPISLDAYVEEMPVPYLDSKPEVININTGRQLFVDDFLIESTTLTRQWHKAEKYEGNPILKPETAQELGRLTEEGTGKTYGGVAAPFSGGVWYDSADGLYKMWYNAGWHDGTAYVTSKDGINWERENYDIVSGTNLVIPHRAGIRRDSSAVIIDNVTTDLSQRYKMFLWSRPVGGEIYTSADGIHWGDPVAITGNMGDRSTIFYNPFRSKWVYSMRSYWDNGKRSREYSECDDLVSGASVKNAVKWARVDNKDLKDPVINRNPELYNVDVVAYESIMLGSFSILLGPTNDECYEVGLPKVTELHLGFSRDGFHFSRSEDRTAFIGATQSDTWDRGYLHSNAAICTVNDDELWFYYTAFGGNTEKAPELSYNSHSNGAYDNGATGLAKLRRDGFASMGTSSIGTLTTELVTFDGKYLYVNANAKSVKAEILDENGNVIEGYSINDCIAVTGDTTKAMLKFGKDLSELSGKNVKFRFTVEEGDLYSFWVSDDAVNGASGGYLAGGSVGQDGLIDTAESYGSKQGDVNGDTNIDAADLALLKKYIAKLSTDDGNYDINKDGQIDAADLALLKKIIAGLL